MTAWSAWRDGVRRVNGAPIVLLGMFSLTLLLALPLSIALRRMIADAPRRQPLCRHGWRRARATTGGRSSSAQASGLGTTFVPSIIGFGAVLDNLGGLLDNLPMAATIAGRHGGVARAVVVPQRWRARSLRPHAAHAHARVLRRVRHPLLALSPASGCSRSSCIGRSSGSSTRGSSTTSIRGPRAT